MIKYGDIVETCVWIGTERKPMGYGRVEKVLSGYCKVDICYPYARPWIVDEITHGLRVVSDEEKKSIFAKRTMESGE